MAPTYRRGDWLLLRRTQHVRPGHVVAFPDPRFPARLLVKRIDHTTAHGWFVLGDNPTRSTDSRVFGAVAASDVLGRVVARYRRAG